MSRRIITLSRKNNGFGCDSLFETRNSDIRAVLERDPAARSQWEVRFLYSGYKAVRSHRRAHWFLEHGHPFIARWISQRSRHKTGIEHFVSTQRTDRTGINRDERPQGAPVTHQVHANAQALIYISRKRLCSAASPETRQAWQLVKDEVAKVEPELASCMVRECVYRGFCPEMKGCGYADTEAFKKAREDYLRIPD